MKIWWCFGSYLCRNIENNKGFTNFQAALYLLCIMTLELIYVIFISFACFCLPSGWMWAVIKAIVLILSCVEFWESSFHCSSSSASSSAPSLQRNWTLLLERKWLKRSTFPQYVLIFWWLRVVSDRWIGVLFFLFICVFLGCSCVSVGLDSWRLADNVCDHLWYSVLFYVLLGQVFCTVSKIVPKCFVLCHKGAP